MHYSTCDVECGTHTHTKPMTHNFTHTGKAKSRREKTGHEGRLNVMEVIFGFDVERYVVGCGMSVCGMSVCGLEGLTCPMVHNGVVQCETVVRNCGVVWNVSYGVLLIFVWYG